MSRKARLFVVCLFLGALALGTALVLHRYRVIPGLARGEAFFRGRPTSYWRNILAIDGKVGDISPLILEEFGHDRAAVPVILECLADSDPNVRWPSILLIQLCAGPHQQAAALRNALDDDDPRVRVPAIRGLGRLGRAALPAIPELVALAGSDDIIISYPARHALWDIDEQSAIKADGWKTFASEEWGFSVAMPGPPEQDKRLFATPYGPAPTHSFAASYGVARCTVAITEHAPEVARDFTEAERHDLAGSTAARGLGGDLLRNTPVRQKGYSGREQEIEVRDKAAILCGRLFFVGHRGYHVFFAYKKEFVHPKSAEYFLNSFEIQYRPPDLDGKPPGND